ALNGEPIEGALVSVAGLSDLTDAAGNYLIENVPIGQLTANFNANPSSGQSPLTVNFFDQSTENSNTVTCSKTDYNTYSNNQVIIPADGQLTLNISLSPNLAEGQMRFVLNWGASPTDLDSHLLTPEIEGEQHHIAYYNEGSETSAPYAALDYDYVNGYGPETVTIYDFFSGTYKYFIHNFSEEAAITTSQAVVQIYGQTGLLHTLQVPTNGSGLIWYVCDIDGNTGQVTIRNVIQENEPGYSAKVSYPAKNHDSKTIMTWQWNFGDGNTSTVQNPTHTYNTNGSYTVSLTVTDNAGNSSTETKTAFIQVDPQGIDEQQQALLKVFPQPAESHINLECAEKIEAVMITDLSGKTLLHKTYDTKKLVLNVDHLKNGVYLLVVTTEKGSIVRKITMR
ncbi:MAG: PKD domain-containing protein, partial [Bacteroidales bacterium]|nr:PKD domain-containing protein [Bacteroidales bacterium]